MASAAVQMERGMVVGWGGANGVMGDDERAASVSCVSVRLGGRAALSGSWCCCVSQFGEGVVAELELEGEDVDTAALLLVALVLAVVVVSVGMGDMYVAGVGRMSSTCVPWSIKN